MLVTCFHGDRTKCHRTECPGLKQTRIRVKVRVEVRFRAMASARLFKIMVSSVLDGIGLGHGDILMGTF